MCGQERIAPTEAHSLRNVLNSSWPVAPVCRPRESLHPALAFTVSHLDACLCPPVTPPLAHLLHGCHGFPSFQMMPACPESRLPGVQPRAQATPPAQAPPLQTAAPSPEWAGVLSPPRGGEAAALPCPRSCGWGATEPDGTADLPGGGRLCLWTPVGPGEF